MGRSELPRRPLEARRAKVPMTGSTSFGPALAALLVVSLFAPLGGCDGGIFGTGGDSDASVARPIDATGEGTAGTDGSVSEGGGTGGSTGDGAGGTTGGDDASPDPDVDAPPDAESTPLENMLGTDADPTPRVRVVNAGATPLALATIDDGETLSSVEIASGTVGTALDVPLGTGAGLWLFRPGGESLARFAPLMLAPSSLTTLVLREDGADVDVVALPTRLASDDPTTALVRALAGSRLDDPDGPPSRSALVLVPDGASPGSAEATLGPLDFDDPSAEYTVVAAGDYRLEDPAGRIAPASLTLEGGAVYTLVVGVPDAATPLVVVDSAPR